MEGICITHSCIPLYTVYMQHIMAHSGGMQEWVIQIPSIPILVSVLFPSLHLKYFRIKFLLLVKPWRACAARVTVVVLCVCLSVHDLTSTCEAKQGTSRYQMTFRRFLIIDFAKSVSFKSYGEKTTFLLRWHGRPYDE